MADNHYPAESSPPEMNTSDADPKRQALDLRRESAGREICTTGEVEDRGNGVFIVRSKVGSAHHAVLVGGDNVFSCACRDHRERPTHTCKHIHAVLDRFPELAKKRANNISPPRSKRDFRKYAEARAHRDEHVLEMLKSVCAGVEEPTPKKTGRPRLLIRDLVFAAVATEHMNRTGWDAEPVVRDLQRKRSSSRARIAANERP